MVVAAFYCRGAAFAFDLGCGSADNKGELHYRGRSNYDARCNSGTGAARHKRGWCGANWTTRVTLDTVVAAYREGMTPEGIAEQYPSLRLNELYSVIGYFLSHTAEVDAYLRQRQEHADAVRRENESRFDPAGVRARLLARKPQE